MNRRWFQKLLITVPQNSLSHLFLGSEPEVVVKFEPEVILLEPEAVKLESDETLGEPSSKKARLSEEGREQVITLDFFVRQ